MLRLTEEQENDITEIQEKMPEEDDYLSIRLIYSLAVVKERKRGEHLLKAAEGYLYGHHGNMCDLDSERSGICTCGHSELVSALQEYNEVT